MIIFDIPQHLEGGEANPEWLALRLGKPTASRMNDLMAKTKTGESASRAKYRLEIVLEVITGKRAEGGFYSPAMAWGTQCESGSRLHHESASGDMVIECTFASHPRGLGGASPDGIIGNDTLWESKSPDSSTHIDYFLNPKSLAAKYNNQCQWQMACCGEEFTSCKLVSYDPRMPEGLKYVCVVIHRDNELITQMEAEVEKFMSEVNEMVEKLQARRAA